MKEMITTVKIKTKKQINNALPSEKRYSASTVLGLAVIDFIIAILALLLSILMLRSGATDHQSNVSNTIEQTTLEIASNGSNTNSTLMDAVITTDGILQTSIGYVNLNDDALPIEKNPNRNKMNVKPTKEFSSHITTASTVAFLVTALALWSSITGLVASRRWYVERNITYFFVSSAISTAVSLVGIFFLFHSLRKVINFSYATSPYNDQYEVVLLHSNRQRSDALFLENDTPKSQDYSLDTVLALNMMITSIAFFVWSGLATKVAYDGMTAPYESDVTRDSHVEQGMENHYEYENHYENVR